MLNNAKWIACMGICVFFACKARTGSKVRMLEAKDFGNAELGPDGMWYNEAPIDYHGTIVQVESDSNLVVLNDGGPQVDAGPSTLSELGSNNEQAFALAGGNGSLEYIEVCRNAQVPIPPQWGSDQWIKRGIVSKANVFASSSSFVTELWIYDNRQLGVCAALPRLNGGRIALFGVICHSMVTGATCFWDNKHPDTGATTTVEAGIPGVGWDVSMAQGGNKLTENCTNCHRGSSPWIRIKGEPTGMLSNLFRTTPKDAKTFAWFPIGKPEWNNDMSPKQSETYGLCAASGCHSLPTPKPGFCNIANRMIERGLMPYSTTKKPAAEAMIAGFQKYCSRN